MFGYIYTFLSCVCCSLQDRNFKFSFENISYHIIWYFIPKITQKIVRDNIFWTLEQTKNPTWGEGIGCT